MVFLLALAFGVGFVPQWWEARTLRQSLAKSTFELDLANLHRTLGLASQEAQRNNFGSAGEAAARFFDRCGALADSPALANEPRTRVALQSYVSQRDAIMALLAAGDPSVRERLGSMFLTMQGVLDRRGE
jgi:hypothetical protein